MQGMLAVLRLVQADLLQLHQRLLLLLPPRGLRLLALDLLSRHADIFILQWHQSIARLSCTCPALSSSQCSWQLANGTMQGCKLAWQLSLHAG